MCLKFEFQKKAKITIRFESQSILLQKVKVVATISTQINTIISENSKYDDEFNNIVLGQIYDE